MSASSTAMEVTVLDAQNAPKKPVLAIRAGSALKHVELSLNQPFTVPLHGMQDNRLKVSLYEQLGTQTIPDADEAESVCNVPVRTPDGACSQVKLRIRRGQTPNGNGLNLKSSAIGVEDYLNHHQLEARIQNLFEIVLKKQPVDPYRCMIEELRKVKGAGEEAAPEQPAAVDMSGAPKAPVAPAGPPPKNARPSPAAKGRNITNGDKSEIQEDVDTQKALAQVMARQEGNQQQSASLSSKRQEARNAGAQALSNLELAHEVMRLTIRNVCNNMAAGSSSLGNVRQDNRQRAIEHAKNVKISEAVIHMVLRSAHTRLQAQSLGLMGGGHPELNNVYKRDSVLAAENAILTECVVKAALTKVLRP